MKKIVHQVLLCCLLLFPILSFATGTYIFDPNHTYVLWHVNHFGFSHPSGKWLADGSLVIDQAKPQDGKLTITIKLEGLNTGIPKFDAHLKGSEFLDVAKYPTATFVSNKIIVTGKNTATVDGTLTLHGISKPVTLNVMLNKTGISPVTNKQTAGFSATTTINRSDFGLGAYVPGVSDQVKIEIEAEAYKENSGTTNAV